MVYQLYYWPHIQGRGEVVRLTLEAGGAKYIDVARDADSVEAAEKKFWKKSMKNPPQGRPLRLS